MNVTTGWERATAIFKSTKFLSVILGCLISIIVVLFIYQFPYQPGWDFRNNLWAPSFLLHQGQSPYNISMLYELGSAVWMPTAIGVFWPIGFLPLQQASNLWWTISLISLIAIVWLNTGHKQPPKLAFVITLFMAFLFPPTISHFSLGQITILICLIFVLIAVFEHNLHPFLISVLIALTLSKPQLAIFVLPGYFYAYLREYGFPRTLVLVFYSVIAVGITSLPLFIFYPQWISDFIRNQLINPTWAHPSSLFILEATFNEIGRALWWLLLLIGSGLNLWLWKRFPKREAVAWSLALTTIITPYVWSWDFVLLIPLLISYLFRKMPRYSSWLLYLGFLACWVVLAYMKFAGYTSDEIYWWVPWYLVGLILLITSLIWSSTRFRATRFGNLSMPRFLIGEGRGEGMHFRS
jgi:hypothetical protein